MACASKVDVDPDSPTDKHYDVTWILTMPMVPETFSTLDHVLGFVADQGWAFSIDRLVFLCVWCESTDKPAQMFSDMCRGFRTVPLVSYHASMFEVDSAQPFQSRFGVGQYRSKFCTPQRTLAGWGSIVATAASEKKRAREAIKQHGATRCCR